MPDVTRLAVSFVVPAYDEERVLGRTLDALHTAGTALDEPYEIIVGSRLVRLCCAGCEGKVLENPAQILATIDEAWDEAGGVPAGVDTDGDDGG